MKKQPGECADVICFRLREPGQKLEGLWKWLESRLWACMILLAGTGSVIFSVLALLLQAVLPNSGVYAATFALVLGLISVLGGLIENERGKTAALAGMTGFIVAVSVLIGAWLAVWVGRIAGNYAADLFGPSFLMTTRKVFALLPPVAVVLGAAVFISALGRVRSGVRETLAGRISDAVRGCLGTLRKTRGKRFDVQVAPGAVILGEDRFLHTLVVGTTGTGKTSRVLKPMIEQDLFRIKNGERLGITVVEPKGDFSSDVAEMARSMGIPVVFINPEDPDTPRFNPLEGDPLTVAEIMRTVLQSLFGKQEAFFRQVQEVMARNTVLLLKAAYEDNVDIKMMTEILRNEDLLKACLEAVDREDGGPSSLTQYFRQEVLGKNKEEMFRHALGLRLQLEDITGNALLNRVLVGKSDVNLDRHLEGGGVLVVNTAMGRLGKLGDVFGQFIIMHFQSAVFRRPGNERTRPYHVLYVDEFPRYVNPDFERLLAIGRSFRCATVLALQTTAQLLLESKPAFRDIVLENCRNKVVLNLGSAEDAKRLAVEFGERQVIQKARTYKQEGPIAVHLYPDSIREDEKYEPRFRYTDLMELKPFHAVVRLVAKGQPLPPKLVKLEMSEWDKRKAGGRSKLYDNFGRAGQADDKRGGVSLRETIPGEERMPGRIGGDHHEGNRYDLIPEVLIGKAVQKLLGELAEEERKMLLQSIVKMLQGKETDGGGDGHTGNDPDKNSAKDVGGETGSPGTRTPAEISGLEVQGRGSWRQNNGEKEAPDSSFFPV